MKDIDRFNEENIKKNAKSFAENQFCPDINLFQDNYWVLKEYTKADCDGIVEISFRVGITNFIQLLNFNLLNLGITLTALRLNSREKLQKRYFDKRSGKLIKNDENKAICLEKVANDLLEQEQFEEAEEKFSQALNSSINPEFRLRVKKSIIFTQTEIERVEEEEEIERERVEKIKKIRKQKEQAEKQRSEKEKKEKLEMERIEREKKEKIEKAKLEMEKKELEEMGEAEREQMEKEKQEQAEKDRIKREEREKAEKEWREKERAERERLKREEQERIDRELKEKEEMWNKDLTQIEAIRKKELDRKKSISQP